MLRSWVIGFLVARRRFHPRKVDGERKGRKASFPLWLVRVVKQASNCATWMASTDLVIGTMGCYYRVNKLHKEQNHGAHLHG